MMTKNFNAKKMFMSAVAAVVFSFVFTTSADASTTPLGGASKSIEAHKCSNEKKQEQKQEKTNIFSSILQFFGIRVK